MIRVLVVDDQKEARQGLRLILEDEPDVEVVSEATDGRQALATARTSRPDVVLTDIRMPRMDGIAAIRQLVELVPTPAVVALTTFDLDEYLFGALQAGAVGFVLKSSEPDTLVDALRCAYRGHGLIDPQMTCRLVNRFVQLSPRPAPPELDTLTERETEVLHCLAEGSSNAEIAATLVITTGTVKIHVARVLAKLGLATRVQAVIYAHRYGITGRT